MALWVIRTGRNNEFEEQFFENNRIYLTWELLKECDLNKTSSRREMRKILAKKNPHAPKGLLSQNTGQLWAFAKKMSIGDWVIIPNKIRRTISLGEITGDYKFDPASPNPFFFHYRTVRWVQKDIPRASFDQDLLYSFGALATICQVQRNDAENRVRAMEATGWALSARDKSALSPDPNENEEDIENRSSDLEEIARDEIAKLIIARFKGHGMARLVDAILKAQGYTTFVSPDGPDKGIDILAAPGPLGFGAPRLCVQVKTQNTPVDRPTLDQLIGTMQNVHAEHGLFVSWSGFKPTVYKELPVQFFRVRLWDQNILIDQLLEHYDKIDDDLRADLPFKRIWTVAQVEEDQ